MSMKNWTKVKFAFSEVNTILGVVSAFLTVICLIDFNKLFPKLSTRIYIVCGIFLIAFLIAGIKAIFTRNVEVNLGDGRSAVIECGDLFNCGDVVVIPVNDSFDTIVNDTIIAKKSVHGQFVTRFFSNQLEELDNQIERALINIRPAGMYSEQKKGKKPYYPIGTTIVVRSGGKDYYLLALTHFKGDAVQPDLEGYYMAILRLMEYLDAHVSGRQIYLPLIGSGLARLGRRKQQVLENLLCVLKMSRTTMVGKIHIVLHKNDLGKINLHNICIANKV